MKIVNARTGKLQEIPFSLGERGRGRWLEEVKVSNREGQEPDGPHDVGFFTFAAKTRSGSYGPEKHCILTKGGKKRGLLLRINTEGTYTRNSGGSVQLLAGCAKLVTAGRWAYGAAGRVAAGPDELWHVEGPAIFRVVLSGGAHKGYGERILVVTTDGQTLMRKSHEIAQIVATDADPGVADVVHQFKNDLPEELQGAASIADELESIENVETTEHRLCQWGTALEIVKRHGIVVPESMMVDGGVSAVGGVESGVLLPGNNPLVALSIGPGGGKRYGFDEQSEKGLVRLDEERLRRGTRKNVLAMAVEPSWHSAWSEYKDGEVVRLKIVDELGAHTYEPGAGNRQWSSDLWGGAVDVKSTSDTQKKFAKIFGLGAPVASTGADDVDEEPPDGGWTMDDLRAKFGQ